MGELLVPYEVDGTAFPIHIEFETLLAEISASFVNIPADSVDREISEVLRRLAEFLNLDISSVWQLDPSGSGALLLTHAHLSPNVPTPPKDMDARDYFPWTLSELVKGKTLVLPNMEQLPPEAVRDRESYAMLNVKAGLIFPLATGGGPIIGAATVGAVGREREWPPSFVTRWRLITQVFANALARKRSEEAMQRLQEQLQHENVYLRKEVQALQGQSPIVGNSEPLRIALAQAQQVATTDSTVLLLGETGTGKELMAAYLHRVGRRSAKPFISTNVAAIPSTLLESELFGREKGAYTGAMTKQIGRFEMADGGTLFLDEIGELPVETQVKLLRVLQQGEFERLGCSKTHRVNVQVIAATNRNLPELIREGRFRQDLFYRLDVFPITLPPLRERPEDIPALVWAFVQEFAQRMGKPIERIRRKDLDALQGHSWPGNVRELRNVVERSMILSEGPELHLLLPKADGRPSTEESKALRDVERSHIEKVLKLASGRIRGPQGAANILGIKAPTLYAMMHRLGIEHGK